MTLSPNLQGAALMNISMLAFTLNDACMKLVTSDLPLFQAIFLRGLGTTAVLVLLAWRQGAFRFRPGRRDMAVMALRAGAEVLATLSFLTALMHLPIATLSAIMQSLPLLVTLAAAVMFRERLGLARLLTVLLGFGGVMLIIRPGAQGFDHWTLLGLGSVAAVVVRDMATRLVSVALPSSLVSVATSVAVTLLGAVGLAQAGWQPVTPGQGGLIVLAAAALIFGYQAAVMVMRVGEIGFVAPFRYMSLFWAMMLGLVIFGTFPDGLTLAGAALVVATGLFALWQERRGRRGA